MKRLFFILQFFLFIAFNLVLLLTLYQLTGSSSSMERLSYDRPLYNHVEEFDPTLERLSSMEKLRAYCDSIYSENSFTTGNVSFENTYPAIASSVVRKRFYHGYSLYGFQNNFLAMLLSQVSMEGLSAIVIPDDILQYPYAACSQQSIVLMELLREKGFTTRKVGFSGKKYGHFCFEAYYNGGWHFYDPDMEPNPAVLNAYNRPDIQFLARHKDILLQAYAQFPAEKVLDIFPNYFYGSPNKFPAPAAMVFQKATKVLSYTIWIIFLGAFILARRKYLGLGRRVAEGQKIYIPRIQEEIPAAYYPKYSA
ncbi:MAG: hypothetical protein ABIR30_09870 [Chitinophagaceae bacterium]